MIKVSLRVKPDPVEAIISNGRWFCDNRDVEKFLRTNESIHRYLDHYGGMPNPDGVSAEHAISIFGGEVLESSPIPKSPRRRVY